MHVNSEILDGISNKFCHSYFKVAKFDIKNSKNTKFETYPVTLSTKFVDYAVEIRDLEIFADDIWVITYPKCGTTLAQEAIWQICNNVPMNSSGLTLDSRFPFLERSSFVAGTPTSIDKVKALPRPRFIKSHLPPQFLPEQLWTVKPKIIIILREPKDAAVSYYHHYSFIHGWIGTKEEFLKLFLYGKILFGDFWLHTKNLLSLRSETNTKTIRFESLRHNLKETLQDLALFLEKPLNKDQISQLLNHLDFKNMKSNPLLNKEDILAACKEKFEWKEAKFSFLRKGKVESYKEEMPQNFINLFDQKTNRLLKELEFY